MIAFLITAVFNVKEHWIQENVSVDRPHEQSSTAFATQSGTTRRKGYVMGHRYREFSLSRPWEICCCRGNLTRWRWFLGPATNCSVSEHFRIFPLGYEDVSSCDSRWSHSTPSSRPSQGFQVCGKNGPPLCPIPFVPCRTRTKSQQQNATEQSDKVSRKPKKGRGNASRAIKAITSRLYKASVPRLSVLFGLAGM